MKRYDEFIINKLLDSYESSLLYSEKNRKNQSIYFNFNRKNLAAYYDEEATTYEIINQMAMELEERGLVNLFWKNGKIGHILEKVALNLESLGAAYSFVKRKEKKYLENSLTELLENSIGDNETINNLCTYLIERIKENKSVKKYFELDNLEYAIELISALIEVTENTEELFIRELSIKLFNDSKKFEALENKIKGVILDFHPNREYLSEVEDLLGEFNILKNPAYVMLKGIGEIQLNASKFCLEDIENGIGINSKDLSLLGFKTSKDVKRLVSIENLTAFNRYRARDAIIIYLGGYHNECRRELLKKLYAAYPYIEYYHWGDIDCGGFRIFNHLRTKTGIPFQPMNMGGEILGRYMKYTRELTQQDKVSLMRMRDDPEFKSFHETIDEMLKYGVKLEQEIVAYVENGK